MESREEGEEEQILEENQRQIEVIEEMIADEEDKQRRMSQSAGRKISKQDG